MTNGARSLDSVVDDSAGRAAAVPGVREEYTRKTCDLAEGYAFYPSSNTPPVPVLTAFADSRLHRCRAEGSWDFERAISEHSVSLIRSYREVRRDAEAERKFANQVFS